MLCPTEEPTSDATSETAKRDTQTECPKLWDSEIIHIPSLCFHRNTDPYKPQHRSERLEPADRVRWSHPSSPGCKSQYLWGSGFRRSNSNAFHLSTSSRCKNPQTQLGLLQTPAVTRFPFYFSCGIAVLNKVREPLKVALNSCKCQQSLQFLRGTLTGAKFL